MTQTELQENFKKYILYPTSTEYYETLTIISNFMLNVVKKHHFDKIDNYSDGEARIVFQMMMTKILHLQSLLKGVTFNSSDGVVLNNIIDPTIVGTVVRNVYETTGMFNTIFRLQDNKEKRTIAYNLWVIAGLSYRQKLLKGTTNSEIIAKQTAELANIENLTNEIISTETFKNLDKKNQNLILNRIQKKEYLIKIENNKVEHLNWQGLTKTMGIKDDLFNSVYNHFSLSSHPSNVSVFQFGEMFSKTGRPFIELTLFNIKYSIIFVSIFIADYINLFPQIKKTFEEYPVFEQILINQNNRLFREEMYSINESWKALG
jgi:hypothetical protein